MLRFSSHFNKNCLLKNTLTLVSIQNDYVYTQNSGTPSRTLNMIRTTSSNHISAAESLSNNMIIKRSFCRKHLRGVQDINAIGQENLVKPPRSLNEDGSSYLGTYGKDGLYHGQGELKSKDGSLYKGSFKNGKKCGRGEHTYECGSKFVGEFVEDQAEGYGELVLVKNYLFNNLGFRC